MKKLLTLSLLILSATLTRAAEPEPLAPAPTPQQLAWQRMELTMFVHFGVNTFSDREWGLGTEDEKSFNPSRLDCRQWAQAAKSAGFKLIMLTAKHHDGFCLWPTRLTEHCVRQSLWKDGHGDVVREFTEAARAEGLRVGLYLSPWDRNNPKYGTDAYNDHFVGQLTELLTQYGTVDEVWFDGACGEGPNGKKQVYDWTRYYATIRKLAPKALIAISGPDIRWVGNESGVARLGEHSVRRHEANAVWQPAECDVSIRPGWFYHATEDKSVKPLAKLLEIYFKSAGRNSGMLLNVPPDREGRFAAPDVQRLQEFGTALQHFRDGKQIPQAVSASASREEHPARLAVDGNLDTYWSTEDATRSGWLELSFEKPVTFNVFDVREMLALGERVTKYHVEAQIQGQWQMLGKGTIIGQRNLRAFPEVTAEKVRLVIDQAAACPAIAEFSVHHFTEAPLDTNASLTSYKTATASNVHSNDTNFGADKAVDDDTDTRWATDDSVGECWLEVDLDKAETFSRMTLNEQEKRIGQFTLEYRNQPDQAWEVAFTGTNVGAKFQTHFPPTTARWVRLHILKASAAPSVSEFNLYKN